jgi:hypothetical protein
VVNLSLQISQNRGQVVEHYGVEQTGIGVCARVIGKSIDPPDEFEIDDGAGLVLS